MDAQNPIVSDRVVIGSYCAHAVNKRMSFSQMGPPRFGGIFGNLEKLEGRFCKFPRFLSYVWLFYFFL